MRGCCSESIIEKLKSEIRKETYGNAIFQHIQCFGFKVSHACIAGISTSLKLLWLSFEGGGYGKGFILPLV